MRIHSYPSVYAVGHSAVQKLWSGQVVIQEKVDGSQISFGICDGELEIRSKRVQVFPEDPGMFDKAVESINAAAQDLRPGYIYRGEYLRAPRHNAITYRRVPRNHIVLFDIEVYGQNQVFLPYESVVEEAERLGFEAVPQFYRGERPESDVLGWLQGFLERESFLGGAKVEGIVVKNYGQFGPDKKILLAKLVRDDFKEVNAEAQRQFKPSSSDIIDSLIRRYRTVARWQKAVQHLRESGVLEGAPRDIGKLLIEVKEDLEREEKEAIKEALWQWAWPRIARGVVAGLPEWYKEQLLQVLVAGGSDGDNVYP